MFFRIKAVRSMVSCHEDDNSNMSKRIWMQNGQKLQDAMYQTLYARVPLTAQSISYAITTLAPHRYA